MPASNHAVNLPLQQTEQLTPERRESARHYLPLTARFAAHGFSDANAQRQVRKAYATHPTGVKYQSLIHYGDSRSYTLEPGDYMDVTTGLQFDLNEADYIALVTVHPSVAQYGLTTPGQFHVIPPGKAMDLVFPVLNLHPFRTITLNPGMPLANLTLVRCLPHQFQLDA